MEHAEAVEQAAELSRRFEATGTEAMLRQLVHEEFFGRTACLSSFGTESAVLLAVVAEIDRHLPVVFIDTGKLFSETLEYRDRLVQRLRLTNLISVGPDPASVAEQDPEGILWYWDPDRCCAMRKVEPLEPALRPYDLVISGRKRYHGALRRFVPRFEAVNGRIKVDPIAHWTRERVEGLFKSLDLPAHPLVAQGYLSVGCAPCTTPAADANDVRSGRWAGRPKTECGIHVQPLAKAS